VLWEDLQRDGMAVRAQYLAKQINKQLSQEQQEEYETIDCATTEYK